MPGPLEGIKVIDMTQVIAGPLACMLLSDLGAEVIKVEPPAFGDLTRLAQFSKGGLNSSVVSNNRGKRSIQIDIAQPDGRDLVLEMIKDADVVVQNMRPGVMERLGVGWDGSSAVNPDIIYCSMSGYGATGPYADRAVYDPIIQAMAGYVALQVNPQVPIPDLVRNGVVDKAAAWMAALAITSALFARAEGKGGQHIELSMLDIAVQFLWPDGGMADTMLDPDIPPSFRLSQIYTLSECADGHLVYFVISDEQFRGLFTALGHPEWMDTYGDAQYRQEHREELGALLGNAFLEWKLADLLPRMHENSVPCGHVNQMEDLPTDPQIVHSGTFVEWEHETAGRIRSPRMSATFSATPPPFKASAPVLNEHVDEVLAEIGITAEQRRALLDAGVIKAPESSAPGAPALDE
ncbi:MAG: CaiB/BaiF CoA-transferase family protein [Acidimicrobiales bacterium]